MLTELQSNRRLGFESYSYCKDKSITHGEVFILRCIENINISEKASEKVNLNCEL